MGTRRETDLVRRDPLGLLRQMTSEFDRVFEGSFWPARKFPVRPFATASGAPWMPGIDVFEKDNQVVIRADLPGMRKDDVAIEVMDGQLVLSGERKSEAEENRDNYYRVEREYGTFYRAIPLPQGVNADDIKATFADGVLEVRVPLPAKSEPKTRRVEIQEGPTQQEASRRPKSAA